MNLPIIILQVLADAAGHPLLKSVLRLQVESRMKPRPMKAVFESAMDDMTIKGHILFKDNELDDDDPLVLLDEKGEVLAAKHRL